MEDRERNQSETQQGGQLERQPEKGGQQGRQGQQGQQKQGEQEQVRKPGQSGEQPDKGKREDVA